MRFADKSGLPLGLGEFCNLIVDAAGFKTLVSLI